MKIILASSVLVASLFAVVPAAVAQQDGKFCLTGRIQASTTATLTQCQQCEAAMKGTSTETCTREYDNHWRPHAKPNHNYNRPEKVS